MKLYLHAAFLCLFAATVGYAAPIAIVDAGAFDRIATPVYLDVDSSMCPEGAKVAVVENATLAPAQMESVEDGKVRIWWIVHNLPAGDSREYEILFLNETFDEDFHWKDKTEFTTRLLFGDRAVLEYVHPLFDTNDIENTKKPFHHVFAPDGSRAITKGVGGLYSHHRGIFFGYNKIQFDGTSLDTWHARNGEHEQHVEFVETAAGPLLGSQTLRIHWNDRDGEPFAKEVRRVRAFRQPDDTMLIEFETDLRTEREKVILDGDRQHAGVQFRAAQYVADHEKETRYLRPKAWADLPPDQQINTPEHKNLPWNAAKFSVENEKYTVVYITHPDNPSDAFFSERLYGRFGEFFRYELTPDNPLHAQYRWWIAASQDIDRDQIESRYHDFANPPEVQLKK